MKLRGHCLNIYLILLGISQCVVPNEVDETIDENNVVHRLENSEPEPRLA
jgi:hypothetical protein